MSNNKKIILITGATGFIGSALARFWAKDNELLLLDKNVKSLEHLQDELNGTPCILPFDYEKANYEDFVKLAQLIAENYPRLDALIHLAVPEFRRTNLMLSTGADLDKFFKVIVKAPFLLTQALKNNLLNSENPKVAFAFTELNGAYWHSLGIMQVALEKMLNDLTLENGSYQKIAWLKLNLPFIKNSPFCSRIFLETKPQIREINEILPFFNEIFTANKGRLSTLNLVV